MRLLLILLIYSMLASCCQRELYSYKAVVDKQGQPRKVGAIQPFQWKTGDTVNIVTNHRR